MTLSPFGYYLSVACKLCTGPSINDVSSEGEGGGPPSKPIYYISLFSNLSQQGEGGGHKFEKMGQHRLWMAPKSRDTKLDRFLSKNQHTQRKLLNLRMGLSYREPQ